MTGKGVKGWRILFGVAVMVTILSGMSGQALAGISLGSAQGGRHAEVAQGGEVLFRVFLFNAHQEDDVEVYTGVYEDGGLSVSVEPERLLLPYTEPGDCSGGGPGYACLSTPQGDVSAREVTVRVSVPFRARLGEHRVSVYAATERQEGTLASAQVRKFWLTVDVRGSEETGLGEEVLTGAGEETREQPGEECGPDDLEGPGKPEGNEEGESLPDSVTGAVSGIPVFGPWLLLAALLALLVLRMVKRI